MGIIAQRDVCQNYLEEYHQIILEIIIVWIVFIQKALIMNLENMRYYAVNMITVIL